MYIAWSKYIFEREGVQFDISSTHSTLLKLNTTRSKLMNHSLGEPRE